MSDEINPDRRRFLGRAAMGIAAAQLGLIGSVKAQSGGKPPSTLPPIKPGTNTSFGFPEADRRRRPE